MPAAFRIRTISETKNSSGRGLTVVAALSVRWGTERTGRQRKVVWAELALRAGTA